MTSSDRASATSGPIRSITFSVRCCTSRSWATVAVCTRLGRIWGVAVMASGSSRLQTDSSPARVKIHGVAGQDDTGTLCTRFIRCSRDNVA